MGPSTPFIRRPIGTTLLTFGLAAAGAVAFFKLPVSPLPQVDFPTISVQATLPQHKPTKSKGLRCDVPVRFPWNLCDGEIHPLSATKQSS